MKFSKRAQLSFLPTIGNFPSCALLHCGTHKSKVSWEAGRLNPTGITALLALSLGERKYLKEIHFVYVGIKSACQKSTFS